VQNRLNQHVPPATNRLVAAMDKAHHCSKAVCDIH
jgi:hypothetical protein